MAKAKDDARAARLAGLASELRVTMGRLVRRLREQSQGEDLTWAQTSVLLQLERAGAATVSDLARSESVRPQSMRVTVAGLKALGAVQGRPDPNDARKTLFALTPAFLKALHRNRAAKEDWLLRALEAQLSASEQQALALALKPLQRLAEFQSPAIFLEKQHGTQRAGQEDSSHRH